MGISLINFLFMPQPTSRRDWLKITAALTAGMSINNKLFAESKRFEEGGIIYLNSNENAYGPSTAAIKAMSDIAKLSNRYPDDMIPDLKKQLASHWDIQPEHLIFGAGSSEILGLVAVLAAMKKKNMVSANPTFGSWYTVAEKMGATVKKIPLKQDDKTLDLDAMLAAMDDETGMVYVCNPNNPTGTIIEDAKLRSFVEACSKKAYVLVDEAYTEFENLPSLKDMAVKNPKIIVAKTFSKIYGLAGARIGYAIAHSDTITKLGQLQPWPNVSISTVTAAAAMASLKDEAFIQQCRTKNTIARDMCYEVFKQKNLSFIPSFTSFVMFDMSNITQPYMTGMNAKKIQVQYRDVFGSRWSRVSMGTVEEMKIFCDVLKGIA